MNLPEFKQIYQQIIAIPSISSLDAQLDLSNKALIEQLATWLEDLGFTVDIQKIANSNQKFNLLASFGDTQLEGGLLLAGHSDTVACDEHLWDSNPFQFIERDDKFYGLGTVDMKGYFAFILAVLQQLKTSGELNKLTKPLYVLATADEEITMSGAKDFLKQNQLKPDLIMIGEPSELIPIRAHKGQMTNIVHVHGKAGHSSEPQSGINAIEIMHQVTGAVLQLQQYLKNHCQYDGFSINYPTLNFGSIHGGNAFNRICSECELVFDIRTMPNQHSEEIKQRLQQYLATIETQWPNRISVKMTSHDAFELPVDHQLIPVIEQLSANSTQTVNYCTEAAHFIKIAPTVVLGPGSIKQAHQANEYIETKYIEPTFALLKRFIEHFCA